MVEVSAITCAICGAPVDPPVGGNVATCSYCGTKLAVKDGQSSRVSGEEISRALQVELLQGFSGSAFGDGRRHGTAEMAAKDWRCVEKGVWPEGAQASSQYGHGWNAHQIIGPPAVYPACGDRSGAWAPGSRISRVEWIEAGFPAGAPPAGAIRVFETCVPGATFAVTMRVENGEEELVWKGPPSNMGNVAQVLEIRLDPPRKVRTVRAYVSNELGSQWSEIDTIGLVATLPVPTSMRAKPRKNVSGCTIFGVVLLVALLIVGVWGITNAAGCWEAPPLEVPSQRIDGANMMVWNADLPKISGAGTVWAAGEARASSQYGSSQWTAASATGAPDVFPVHRDDGQAWASRKPDRGEEWLEVGFPETLARSVVIVETFHPGALVRIDDMSDPEAPVVLWQGTTAALQSSRVLSLELPQKRAITRIRLVADTSRVDGWYAVDAVGLVP